MKTWKKIFIIALCVIALAAIIIAGLVAYAYYDKNRSYYYENSPERVSENIVKIECYENGSYYDRLKDLRTDKFTTPKLQHIFLNHDNTEDSLVVFRSTENRRGYLNTNTGQIVIPAQYDRAWNFSEGLAAVYKNGIVSFITSTGEPAFPNTFPIRYEDYYDEISPLFHNGLCVMRTLNNKWGLINTQGEWVVEPIYNSIYAPQLGYRIITDGKKYGLLTLDGKTALPLEYDRIRPSSDNCGFVLVRDGFAREVDTNLQTIIPFVYDGLFALDYVADADHDDYNASKYLRYDICEWSGVMDIYGNVIIPAKYYMVRIVNSNLFEVEVTGGGERILFNAKGQPVCLSGI